jgi:hypothetical protein
MRVAATTSQGSEFQNFLYAPICQDQEGMMLSVLSALARQDVDPWAEAARLSQLPKETAVKQITDLLDGLPRRTLACLDRVEVAARLSALLPGNSGSKVSRTLSASATARGDPRVLAFNWRFFYLYLGLMLLMNWFMAELRTPLTPPTTSKTPPGVVTNVPTSDSPSSSLGDTVPTSDR